MKGGPNDKVTVAGSALRELCSCALPQQAAAESPLSWCWCGCGLASLSSALSALCAPLLQISCACRLPGLQCWLTHA